MSAPEFVEKPGSGPEALLRSKHVQNPYPYPETTSLLPSYSTETPESTDSSHLRKLSNHALAHSWKYNPTNCSVKGAFDGGLDVVKKPSHGLRGNESQWTAGGKLTVVQNARIAAHVDSVRARKSYKWKNDLDEKEETLNIDCNNICREVDEFYGPDGTDLRPIDNDSDEGYSEPNDITTTMISLPEKSLREEGVTPGGIFQDSGISMDQGYSDYSLAHSIHNIAKKMAAMPTDGPAFSANVAPFRTPKQTGRWLELIGDQKQCEWPGRRQGPYDLDGLRFQRKVNSRPSEAQSQSSDREQSFVIHGNTKDPISDVAVETNETSVGAIHPVSEGRPTSFSNSIENVSDNGKSVPASHLIRKAPQIDDNACRSIPDAAFNTPVNQRINQTQKVQMKTPATPATIDIYLTPECKTNMVVGDVSDGSLEVRLPKSPFTKKGQSELDLYVQETSPHSELARQDGSAMSLDGSEFEDDPLVLPLEVPRLSKGHASSSKCMELKRNKSDAMLTLSPPKPSQDSPPSPNKASIPTTPANATDPGFFRPITPFQLSTSAHEVVFDSPGTPTPAPRGSQAKGKSVTDIFNSPKLGSRSPERAKPNPDIIIVNPTAPVAGATDQHRGSQGLLFQKAKKNEKGTKNVLNSLRYPSPERGFGAADRAGSDDFEDELSTVSGGEVFKRGKSAAAMRSRVSSGVRTRSVTAQAVVMPNVRARDENEGGQTEVQPRAKKARLSTKE